MSCKAELTNSFCVLPWIGGAISSDSKVVPCCKWMGPHGSMDSAPSITDGLQQAFDSKFWQDIRNQMMQGQRPTGCKKCWEAEDNNRPSDRFEFQKQFNDITIASASYNKVKFLETGISSLCNLACVMCQPGTSSTLSSIVNPDNKLQKAFHQDNNLLNSDLSELRVLKFVGGEPMLEHKHDELLEKILRQNINPKKLEIEYHTNCTRFPSKKVLDAWKRMGKVRIILSIDGTRDTCYYQRPGRYTWDEIEEVVSKYVAIEKECNIVFASNTVVTALNISYITEIADWIQLKVGHNLEWCNANPIAKNFKYIDFRNISSNTKTNIKSNIQSYVSNNQISQPIHMVENVLSFIDEIGNLDYNLTKEIIRNNHSMKNVWDYFNIELTNLEI